MPKGPGTYGSKVGRPPAKKKKRGSCGRKRKRLSTKKANDACARKVKSRYKVWPSAYASGAVAKYKVGAKNWGNKSCLKKNKKGAALKKWFKVQRNG